MSARSTTTTAVGDAGRALAEADVTIEARYGTPTQHHNPMELFTTTCAWSGGKLTIYKESSQFVDRPGRDGGAPTWHRPRRWCG